MNIMMNIIVDMDESLLLRYNLERGLDKILNI